MAVDLTRFAGQYPQEVLDAVVRILESKPEQVQQFLDAATGGFDLPGFLESTLGWWGENGAQVADKLDQFAPEMALIDALGYQVNPAAVPATIGTIAQNGGTPIEQGILQTVWPGLSTQIAGDAGRQATVTDLTNQTNAAFGSLRDTLGQSAMTFDSRRYFQDNPDVAAAFNGLPAGTAPGARNFNGRELTADQFAQQHYETYGKNEGRQPAYTSQVLDNQINAANTAATAQTAAAQAAAQSQLTALQQQFTTMQGALQGALGQQAAALAQNIATLNQNLTTLDASQRANLAEQIRQQQANLERSITAQQAALAEEVQSLQGNATAAATARRQALEQQISELTAAQAPVAEARVKGAEALQTAINIGLEGTTDQLRAEAAREGFVGGSTMQDAALARATIGARQDAARVGADARVSNAMDTRDIARTGAGGRYSISDAYATDTQRIGDFGATGRAGLATNLATGTQAIGDAGASGTRQLSDTTALNRANIGNYGATQTYDNANRGIWSNLDLTGQNAGGQFNIQSALAQQTQDIANRNAAARVDYTNQLYPNAVNAAQAAAGLPAAQAGALTALIPYGTAGTTNALNTLNWWSTNATPPNSTAVTTAPSTSGNSLAGLGASALGSAFQIGNASNWWQPRTTTTPATTTTNASTTANRTGLQLRNPWVPVD
jgi:hypothetical protein